MSFLQPPFPQRPKETKENQSGWPTRLHRVTSSQALYLFHPLLLLSVGQDVRQLPRSDTLEAATGYSTETTALDQLQSVAS